MADNPMDPTLRAAFLERQEAYVDERDPRGVLIAITRAKGWNDQDERLLNTLSADDFQAMFEDLESDDLRQIVQQAIRMSVQGGEDTAAMRASVQEALARIANKSPLRAQRLRSWGFRPDAA